MAEPRPHGDQRGHGSRSDDMSSRAGRRYPSNALIKRLIAGAREAGIDVVGVEVSPEGVVKMLAAQPSASSDQSSAFDRFEAQL